VHRRAKGKIKNYSRKLCYCKYTDFKFGQQYLVHNHINRIQ